MRIFRDETEYQGTPEEIAEFFLLHDTNSRNIEMKASETPVEWSAEELKGNDEDELAKSVRESADLRAKLAADPNYSPFGGVSKSPESIPEYLPTAETNTGVNYV